LSRIRPFLSVIVPAHKAESLLPDTLGALRNSDFVKEQWELIVVDDASRDRTALIAAQYADTVPVPSSIATATPQARSFRR
jgi:glycosyltransferase involved in cell wall biosynthesis